MDAWPLPRLIAHRGGGALAPENTLAGIREAARRAYRAVEFDVMLSADGVPVLIHDQVLERTTDGHGRVCDLSFAQLSQLDAGRRFAPRFAGEPIPRFDQALELCHSLGLAANVEIKPAGGTDRDTGRVVAAWAAEFGRDVPIVLSSFSLAALEEVQTTAPICRVACCSAIRRSIGSASCKPPVPCRCTARGLGCVRWTWLPPGRPGSRWSPTPAMTRAR